MLMLLLFGKTKSPEKVIRSNTGQEPERLEASRKTICGDVFLALFLISDIQALFPIQSKAYGKLLSSVLWIQLQMIQSQTD